MGRGFTCTVRLVVMRGVARDGRDVRACGVVVCLLARVFP